MVSILMMQMKLSVLRHSLSGIRKALMISGAVLGLLCAVGTIWLAFLPFTDPATSLDLLSVVFAIWMLGWIVLPIFGGGDTTLRPESFRLLPLSPRRLAFGLLSAAFIGVGPAVTLIAFAALPMYALHLHFLPVLIAIPTIFLQLVCTVLLSKVLLGLLGSTARSWFTREFSAILLGLLIGLVSTGWTLYPIIGAINQAVKAHPSEVFSLVARLLPSGWGLVAVDAASRSDWLGVLGAFAALLIFSGLLLLLWSHMLHSQAIASARQIGLNGITYGVENTLLNLLPATPLGAVIGKELRSWRRDFWRARFLHMAAWCGFFLCTLPIIGGSYSMLPWMGVIVILFAAIPAGNLYALDGSAFWSTLMIPNTARIDIRGRQCAWLLLIAPGTLLLTIVLTAVSHQDWAWPWVLSIVPALLGGAAGVLALNSIFLLAPLTDPLRRGSSPMISGPNNGQITVQMRLTLLFVMLTALPTFFIILLGLLLHLPELQWAGVPVGIGSGILFSWWFGWLAAHKLEVAGPELLMLMQKGGSSQPETPKREKQAGYELPRSKAIAVGLLVMSGILLFITEGWVALILKLAGVQTRAIFLAFYLPPNFQLPGCIGCILAGFTSFLLAGLIVWRHRRQPAEREAIA